MDTEGKKVMVTGGAGFIGSHLVEEYLKNDAEKIIVYDDFSSGTMENLIHIKDNRLKIVKGSILDESLLNRVVRSERIDIIDHQAAELEIYSGIRDAKRDAEINIFGTINVLNSAIKNNVKKVLFASSGAVYGRAETAPQSETCLPRPHWPYGVSKLSAERYCLQYNELYGLNVTAFRYSIVYGPREWFGRVLTMFIKRIFLENKPPIVFGDGTQTRDYVYVKDLVKAHMLAIRSDKSFGQVFNISSGKGIKIRDLASLLLEISGKNFDIIFDDPKEGEASQYQPERIRLPGELKTFVLDNGKARSILGWKPKTELRDGLIEEINWILENPSRWRVKPRV
ncbi:MAG TPA: NAD-dependent epimerase/dehydratase family protein [Candidatus Bathyarchaeota archaeon]|nr:NAD-dependent epimerase/dehydratase family protein [Candidatus Bathyarchaeota archaeon]